ncbi:MAG: hypothetical protein ACI9QV_001153 [Methylophagaceae bacterium]|jgi:hypothetical protein
MKLIYTRENRFLVYNIQNIVENAGLTTILKNEYASSAAGDLAPHETWLELWVLNEDDYPLAMRAIRAAFDQQDAADWVCQQCSENNIASFELCWQCQTERPD